MIDYSAPNDLLNNRTILVTGAGSGLGRITALACAAHGATVILLGRTLSNLEQVYDEIEAAGSPQAAIYPLNLEGATDHDYHEMANKFEEEFTSLDGIVHCAAELRILSRIDDYDLATWFRVMQVNLNGPMMLTQACLPLLRSAPDASIVFTSDTVGRTGKAYWGAYGVSKFGIEGFMQILADELKGSTEIKVNSIAPGAMKGKIRSLAYPGEDADSIKTPDDLMPLYLWLLGKDSKGVTGQALNADA